MKRFKNYGSQPLNLGSTDQGSYTYTDPTDTSAVDPITGDTFSLFDDSTSPDPTVATAAGILPTAAPASDPSIASATNTTFTLPTLTIPTSIALAPTAAAPATAAPVASGKTPVPLSFNVGLLAMVGIAVVGGIFVINKMRSANG